MSARAPVVVDIQKQADRQQALLEAALPPLCPLLPVDPGGFQGVIPLLTLPIHVLPACPGAEHRALNQGDGPLCDGGRSDPGVSAAADPAGP